MPKCERCGGSVIVNEELNEDEHIISYKCIACGHNHEETDVRKQRYAKRIMEYVLVDRKAQERGRLRYGRRRKRTRKV